MYTIFTPTNYHSYFARPVIFVTKLNAVIQSQYLPTRKLLGHKILNLHVNSFEI
jgi:hypothetical protein